MKKLILITSTIILYNLSQAQIQMNSSGSVGIGTQSPNSNYALTLLNMYVPNAPYVGLIIDYTPGNAYTKSIYPTSNNQGQLGISTKAFSDIWYYNVHALCDARQKENIRDIKNSLSVILQLKGVEYDLKKEYVYIDSIRYSGKMKEKMEKGRKDKFGFLAQDVQKVLPQVVFHDDSTDIYSMDYTRIIPVLVEAIKQMESQIDSLKMVNIKTTNILKSGEITPGIENISIQNDKPSLYQNTPNPFSQSTNISYYLPETVQNATIYIYDMNGVQIKSIPINTKGKASIIINGNELKPGMYLYTLITDGQEVATKRMILTD